MSTISQTFSQFQFDNRYQYHLGHTISQPLSYLQQQQQQQRHHHHHHHSEEEDGPAPYGSNRRRLSSIDKLCPIPSILQHDDIVAPHSIQSIPLSPSPSDFTADDKDNDETMSIAQPAWTKLKTKAGKDRKRLPLACTNCRHRKIRCSGEQPTCSTCTDSGRPCTYRVTSQKSVFRHDPRAQQLSKSRTEALNNLNHKKGVSRGRSNSSSSSRSSVLAPRTKTSAKAALDDISKELQEHLFDVFFEHIHGHPCYLLHRPSCMDKLRNNDLPTILILSICAAAARHSKDRRLISSSDRAAKGEKWAESARQLCKDKQDEPHITTLTCILLLCMNDLHEGNHERSWSLSGQAIRMAYALGLHEDSNGDLQTQSTNRSLGFREREIRRRVMWTCILVDRITSIFLNRPVFIAADTVHVPPPVGEMFFELDGSIPIDLLESSEKSQWDLFSDLAASRRREDLGVTALMIRSLDIWHQVVTLTSGLGSHHDSTSLERAMSQLNLLGVASDALLGGLPKQLEWSKENARKQLAAAALSHYMLLHLSLAMSNIFFCQASIVIASLRSKIVLFDQAQSNIVAQMLIAARLISAVLSQCDLDSASMSPFAGYCALLSTRIQSLHVSSPNAQIQRESKDNSDAGQQYLHDLAQIWRPFEAILEYSHDDAGSRNNAPSSKDAKTSSLINRYASVILNMELAGPGPGCDWDDLGRFILEQGSSLCSNRKVLSESSATTQVYHSGKLGSVPHTGQQPVGIGSGAATEHTTTHPLPPAAAQMIQQHEGTSQSPSEPPYAAISPLTPQYQSVRVASMSSENMPMALARTSAPGQAMVGMESCHLDVDNGGWYNMPGNNMFNDAAYLSSWFLPYIDQGGQQVAMPTGDSSNITNASLPTGPTGAAGGGSVGTGSGTSEKPFPVGEGWCL
ncbi:hypothetical protein VHEMI07742 [[Torrubiella] hemipterigena]|uniref:Zn(2)-C6 fungal-type domain-containing protein n=1 Tax=[Torrubiella] hemipterigena TaxID=1531966 RepID=A0A0A1TBA1_9HYPO|nr:hypothetical protein VHEMI07742 [[Torrubiella] hemipterigena]